MFGKEINLSKGNTSIISKDLNIKGNLNSEGLLEIEGKIDGDINGNIITLRETASVSGNITAKTLNIKGKFTGIIKSERINISGKADIKGTLEYVSLCVEDGASIEGDLKRASEIKAVSGKANYKYDNKDLKDTKFDNKEKDKENK